MKTLLGKSFVTSDVLMKYTTTPDIYVLTTLYRVIEDLPTPPDNLFVENFHGHDFKFIFWSSDMCGTKKE